MENEEYLRWLLEGDYYRLLGIHPESSDELTLKAYRHALGKFHPDKNPNQKSFYHEITVRLNEGYDVLKYPEKRRNYNRMLLKNKLYMRHHFFEDPGNGELKVNDFIIYKKGMSFYDEALSLIDKNTKIAGDYSWKRIPEKLMDVYDKLCIAILYFEQLRSDFPFSEWVSDSNVKLKRAQNIVSHYKPEEE